MSGAWKRGSDVCLPVFDGCARWRRCLAGCGKTLLVCLVALVCLVHLVCLVSLVYLVSLVQSNKRNKPNRPDKPNQPDRPNGPDGPARIPASSTSKRTFGWRARREQCDHLLSSWRSTLFRSATARRRHFTSATSSRRRSSGSGATRSNDQSQESVKDSRYIFFLRMPRVDRFWIEEHNALTR